MLLLSSFLLLEIFKMKISYIKQCFHNHDKGGLLSTDAITKWPGFVANLFLIDFSNWDHSADKRLENYPMHVVS